MSLTALETVVRHELGHALGLTHSSDPEDLMYPIIETNFLYTSECDVDPDDSSNIELFTTAPLMLNLKQFDSI